MSYIFYFLVFFFIQTFFKFMQRSEANFVWYFLATQINFIFLVDVLIDQHKFFENDKKKKDGLSVSYQFDLTWHAWSELDKVKYCTSSELGMQWNCLKSTFIWQFFERNDSVSGLLSL